MIRNGNNTIPFIILNTTSRVKPTILNGINNNHTSGKSTNMINANGQQITSNMNQRANPINVLIN